MPIDGLELIAVVGHLGKITKSGSSYAATLGALQVSTGKNNTAGTEWRGFLRYDTSLIPPEVSAEEIFLVSLYIRRRTDPAGEPQTYVLKISIGAWVGPTLDGDAEEWNGGTLVRTLSAKPADKDDLDLHADGIDPVPLLNRSGQTDVKLWDASDQGSGDPSWGTNFNATLTEKCKLAVVWQIILATATGAGSSSASAEILRLGSATASAAGTADLSGILIAAATGTASGAGSAELSGVMTAAASATASAGGSADLTAFLTAAAAGVASAAGMAELLAGVLLATATGAGTGIANAELFARLVLDVRASATGIGTAGFLGGILLASASGVATGDGIADLIAEIILGEGPAATATGIGTASLLGGVHMPPLALPELTQSLSPVNLGTIAFSRGDSRTAALSPIDSRICIPRRVN